MSETAPPQAAGGIELEGVSKRYGGEREPAVHPTDLRIERGEFFSLLGPSGCGKSTTLRMIAGFEEPTAGRVLLSGADVTRTPAYRRDVNLVFQSYALFPHLDVAGNVGFGLRRRGLSRQEIAPRVAEALALVSLEGYDRRRPSELSGGQQQRVAVARALVNRPQALLLDEPLGALDLKLRKSMQSELKRIQREVGITFLYVTHDQEEALTMSDRIAVMNAGRIEQVGSPQEVYERPTSRFVAGFIGVSNLIDGTVARVDGDALELEAADGDGLVVPRPRGRPVAPGERIVFTVRPEKLAIAEEPGDHRCRLRATVESVAYQGTATSYTLSTRHGAEIVAFRPNTGEPILQLGRRVWLCWRPEQCAAIVGDAATGAAAAVTTDTGRPL